MGLLVSNSHAPTNLIDLKYAFDGSGQEHSNDPICQGCVRSKVFSFLKYRGAERISARGKSHGLRSGYPPLQIHGLVRSGYPPWNMSRSGADFLECVSERISACGESHGLSQSGYPPLPMSRVIAERIPVARFFSRSGLSHCVEQTAHNRGIRHGAP